MEMLKQDPTTLEFRYFNIFSHIQAKGDFESLQHFSHLHFNPLNPFCSMEAT